MSLLLHRLPIIIPTLLCLSLCVFLLLELAPGDAADVLLDPAAPPEAQAALRAELGLDLPLLQRFGHYLGRLLQGDMGISAYTGGPVSAEIARRLPYTLVLTAAAVTLGVLVGVSLGIVSALRQNTLWDVLVRGLISISMAVPSFWLALLLVSLFALQLGWLPVFGSESARHLVLPAICTAFPLVPGIARMTRASLLETLHADFILVARSKGLRRRHVLRRHVLRVAAIPVVTYVGLQTVRLVSSLVIIETIFNWPGLGGLVVRAAFDRDPFLLQGATLVIATLTFAILFVVDLVVLALDPRIQSHSLYGQGQRVPAR